MKHSRAFAAGTFLGALSLLLLLGSCSGDRDEQAARAGEAPSGDDMSQTVSEGGDLSSQGTNAAQSHPASETDASPPGQDAGTDDHGNQDARFGADGSHDVGSGIAAGQDVRSGAAVDGSEATHQAQTDSHDQVGDQGHMIEPVPEEEGPQPFPEHIRAPTLRAADTRPMAPDVPLTDINGRTVTMEQLRGQVVLVVFWATWCPPCKREIPHLVHLQETYGDLGLTILAPSLDQKGLAAIKPFLRSRPDINYTIIPSGHRLSMAYGGVNRIPTSYLIDKKGRVVEQIMGLRSGEELEGLVMAALKEDV